MSLTFQSTLPQGKWRPYCHGGDKKDKFQSTLPQGKWPSLWSGSWSSWKFQSTLPQGKWLILPPPRRLHKYFNPHFRKGSDPLLMFHNFWKFYFNPHFRKGSDKIATGFPIERVISIHTSAREVTERDIVDMVADIISIHTSAREVTDGEWWEKDICRFQSTLPQGKWPMRTYGKRSDSLFQSTLPQGKWPRRGQKFSQLW